MDAPAYSPKKFFRLSSPARIIIIYFIFGAAWAFTSNSIINSVFTDIETIKWISIYKGWFLILITSLLFYFLIKREVSKHERLRNELTKNEEKYRNLVEASQGLIWIIDAKGNFKFLSKNAVDYYGIESEKLIGRNYLDFKRPELAKTVKRSLEKIIDSGGNSGYFSEDEIVRPDGRIISIISNGVLLKDNSGVVTGLMGTTLDITERKKIEEEAREINEQIKIFYQASQKLNLTLDINEICQTITESLTGIVPSDSMVISSYDDESKLITFRGYWLGKKQLDVRNIPPLPLGPEGTGIQSAVIRTGRSLLINDYDEITKKNLYTYSLNESGELIDEEPKEKDVIHSGLIVPLKVEGKVTGVLQVLSFEKNSYTQSQLKLVESLSNFISAAQENALLYNKVNKELSERKKAEEALRKSDEKYQIIFESTGTATMIVEEDTTISMVNNECLLLTGYNPNELIGQKWTRYVASESLEEMLKNHNLRREDPDKAPSKYEVKLVNKKGELRNAILDIGMIPDTGQSVVSIIDVTEQKKSEEASREINEQIKILYQASQKLNLTLDINEICQTIFESLSGIVPSDCMTISSYDDKSELITFRGHWIENKQVNVSKIPPIPLGKGVQSTVIGTGSSLLVNDYDERTKNNRYKYFFNESGELVDNEPKEEEIIHSGIIVPLKLQGKVTGVLQVLSFNKNQYSQNQLSLVESLSNHISAAQENALLYDKVNKELTERKKAEEALRASEEKYRRIVDTVQEVIWILDTEGRYKYLNESCKNFYGYEPEEMIGRPFTDFRLPEYAEKDFKFFKRSNYTLKNIESKLLRKDGKLIDVLINSTVIKDNEGNITGVIGSSLDITERKKTEEQIRFSEEKYRNIVETANEGIWVIDKENKTTFVNRKLAQMLGLEVIEMLGRSIFEFIETADIAQTQDNLELRRKGISAIHEFKFLKKNGESIWALINMTPLLDKDGDYEGALAMITNINERKLAQDALKESENKYRTVLETTPFSVRLIDLSGNILYANRQTAVIHGYNHANEMIGINVFNLTSGDSTNKAKGSMKEVIEEGFVKETELKYLKKDGTDFPAELSASLLRDEDGKPVGIISVVQDISDKKKAQEELLEHKERLSEILASAMDAIITTDEDRKIILFNKAAERLFKCSVYDALGKDINIFIPDKFHESHNSHFHIFPGSGEANTLMKPFDKLTAFRSDGTEVSVETSVSKTEIGSRKLYTVILRDITQRLKSEAELMDTNSKLHLLAARLQSTREEERLLISRDIHDQVGQELTALKMDIVMLAKDIEKKMDFPAKNSVIDELKSMAGLTDKTIKWIRNLSSELRPDVLDRLGLFEAIQWHCSEFERRAGIKCETNLCGDDSVLTKEQSIVFFRIFQESLTNVQRHSNAAIVKVSMMESAENLNLIIEDNGKGITEKELEGNSSLGLLGMKERAYVLGGNVSVTGIEAKGTTVNVIIPKLIKQDNE
jgi:PAS domain S-box-containing protein